MTGFSDEVRDAAQQIFDRAGHSAYSAHAPDSALWKVLSDGGFTRLAVPEEAGGSGGSIEDAAIFLELAAYYNARIPLADFLVAVWLASMCGLTLPEGDTTFARDRHLTLVRKDGRWLVTGSATQVPWARMARWVVSLCRHDGTLYLVRIPISDGDGGSSFGVDLKPSTNLAGEQRDDLRFANVDISGSDVVAVPGDVDEALADLMGALTRTIGIAGASRRVLDRCIRYTQERQQFGRPIAGFQAVQHHLATLAAETTAVQISSQSAVRDATLRGRVGLATALAKAQASSSAGTIAAIGHQLHGAIGFTQESGLGESTTRLWSWREEYGNETKWFGVVATACTQSGDAWALISD